MRRVSITIFALFVSLFIAGCGAGGGDTAADGLSSDTTVAVKSANFSSTATDGSVTLSFTSAQISDVIVIIDSITLDSDKYNITINSVTPDSLRFDAGGQKSVTISFAYTPKSSSVSGNLELGDLILKYRKILRSKLSNTETSQQVTVNSIQSAAGSGGSSGGGSGGTTTPAPVTTGYQLSSASSAVTVTSSNQLINIYVALSYTDIYGNSTPVVGKSVNANFIQPIYGKLISYSSVTDSSGIATFIYISPERVQDINNTELRFYWADDPTVTLNMDLQFNTQGDILISNLYIEPSNLVISTPGQQKTIKVITVNAENVGVPAQVQIEQLANGDGNSYGSFDKPSVITTDASGTATIIYTAPDSLPDAASRTINISANAGNDSSVVKQLTLQFETIRDTNATDYEISLLSDPNLEVNRTGQITVQIHETGNSDKEIPSSYVYDVNVTSRFTNLLDINGSATARYSGRSTRVLEVHTSTVSGTALVDISADIFNGEKRVTITKTVPVTILSGPVSSLSLVYVGTEYIEDDGLFRDIWNIHAVDKYSNPAREGVTLYPTLINGYKVIGYAEGAITASNPAQFTGSSGAFIDVAPDAPDNDRLIIMPQSEWIDRGWPRRIDKSYLGDWTITSVVGTDTLVLDDYYNGPDADRLKYIVGGEKRALADIISLAHVDSGEDPRTFQTDANGNVRFKVIYDPMLVGHTYTLSAKTYAEDGSRSGTAVRTNFRGMGYNVNSVKIDNDGNTHTVTLSITIKPNSDPLVDVAITLDSVTSDSGQCVPVKVYNNTSRNGKVDVDVNTLGDANKAKECTISWITKNSSIYFEY